LGWEGGNNLARVGQILCEQETIMKRRLSGLGRGGFTLIEILVALILLAVLSSFLIPGVVQQLKASDAPRIANDLTSIRTALTTFTANVPPVYPGDLEDLVYKPVFKTSTSDSDVTLTNQTYSVGQIGRWNGEYLETLVAEKDNGNSTGNALKTGFNGDVQYELRCFDPAATVSTALKAFGTCTSGDYVVVRVLGVSAADFYKVNDLIDGDPAGESASDKETKGKLRFLDDGTSGTAADVTFFLAAPFRS
jgi:prepilin-type N-terminal cleavage/methylation domain-containing protein